MNNNREIAREYGISESMVRKWRNQQHVLFTGELKMTAKRASMGRHRPKDPELDQDLANWFSDQRLFEGILFICARVVSFAAARAANDTTRAQIEKGDLTSA